MAPHFVLRGPKERKEGGDAGQKTNQQSPLEAGSTNEPGEDTPNVTRFPAVYPDEDELIVGIRHQYSRDPFFRRILDSPTEYRNFQVDEGLIHLCLKDKTLLCVPDVKIRERTVREIVISQAHSLLAHLGASKTLTYLRDHVWWKSMVNDVNAYCASCITCKRSKPSNQKPYGLLNPLPVPTRPWESIGMDFIGPLPMSKDRNGEYDAITVIIELLTGMVHLVPSRVNYTAKEVAELVFAEVYKHHGLPRAIISDRDVLFTSTFWTHMNELLGINQRMSSAYHPESDGSTERVNRTIGQMVRAIISPTQTDWVTKLPAIEFAINTSSSESTKSHLSC